jgi:serine/threonine protein kinase
MGCKSTRERTQEDQPARGTSASQAPQEMERPTVPLERVPSSRVVVVYGGGDDDDDDETEVHLSLPASLHDSGGHNGKGVGPPPPQASRKNSDIDGIGLVSPTGQRSRSGTQLSSGGKGTNNNSPYLQNGSMTELQFNSSGTSSKRGGVGSDGNGNGVASPKGQRNYSSIYEDDSAPPPYEGPSSRPQSRGPTVLAQSGGSNRAGSQPGSRDSSGNYLLASTDAAATKRIVIQRNPESVLGKGGYGTVYRAYNTDTHEPLAVKEVTFDEQNLNMVKHLRVEFETLRQLEHPHIVRVFDFSLDGNKKARIFMELMEGGSVRTLLKRRGGKLDELTARRVMFHALLGMEFLHSKGILHRDLKPDNMLVDRNGDIKLSDFGTCRETIHAASGTTTQVVGTVSYMAPENITGRYSQGSDIWAWAATYVEVLTGKMPWSELKIEQSISLLFHIGSAKPPNHHPKIPAPPRVSEECAKMLEWCFSYQPKDRPTARALLDSEYFAEELYAEDSVSSGSEGQSHRQADSPNGEVGGHHNHHHHSHHHASSHGAHVHDDHWADLEEIDDEELAAFEDAEEVVESHEGDTAVVGASHSTAAAAAPPVGNEGQGKAVHGSKWQPPPKPNGQSVRSIPPPPPPKAGNRDPLAGL